MKSIDLWVASDPNSLGQNWMLKQMVPSKSGALRGIGDPAPHQCDQAARAQIGARMSHAQIAITALHDALIDADIVDAVLAMNAIAGIETLSSCQGNPGPIEIDAGMYGHIAFRHMGGWQDLVTFCMIDLRLLFREFIDDEIRIDIFCNSNPYGWLNFRNEMLPLVTQRLAAIAKTRDWVSRIPTPQQFN